MDFRPRHGSSYPVNGDQFGKYAAAFIKLQFVAGFDEIGILIDIQKPVE
jgi:hypothetical protein